MSSRKVILIIWGVIALATLTLILFIWKSPRKTSVVVEWSTASEINTVGFNIYRSESREGPSVKINHDAIPTSTDPLTGGNYSYTDNAVQPGHIYYYWLEDLDSNGFYNRNGPIEVKSESGNKYYAMLVIASVGVLIIGVLSIMLPRRADKLIVKTED
jgi:hypothetical protein